MFIVASSGILDERVGEELRQGKQQRFAVFFKDDRHGGIEFREHLPAGTAGETGVS
jgi:hypothetical protein